MPRPPASSEAALRRMTQQKRHDTAPELALRRELWRRGLRYRVQYSVLRKRIKHDIVFPAARLVVEVRGCFWHSCPVHGSIPKSNREWWLAKLEGNRSRDAAVAAELGDAGWKLLVVWEHDDAVETATAIEETVRSRQKPPGNA